MKRIDRKSFLASLGLGLGLGRLGKLKAASFIQNDYRANHNADKKLKIALCGLGNYALALAEGIKASSHCELTGVVTGHPEKAEKWKKEYNLASNNIYNYQNFDQIRSNSDIDLVYVVLPNGLHKEFTIRTAEAGKHVITEKPMAILAKDCAEMIHACKKAGVQLGIGYRLHFEPYNQEIKRLGQEKVFGQVRMMEAGLGYKTFDLNHPDTSPDLKPDWRLVKGLSGGGPLMDLGIYCVQSCRYVLGEEPRSVTAQFGPIHNPLRFHETEESITWQMEFPGGALANCSTSVGFNVDRFYASADEGFFELSPGLSYGPFKLQTSKGETHFPIINQQAAQLDAMAQYILAGKPLPDHINGTEGMKDMKVINGIYDAARSGRRVQLV